MFWYTNIEKQSCIYINIKKQLKYDNNYNHYKENQKHFQVIKLSLNFRVLWYTKVKFGN